jgi:peptidoglycan/LPS O-acetylase OafA/YrhL
VILQSGSILILSGAFFVLMKKLEPDMIPRNYQTVLDVVLMPLASVIILTFILAFRNLKNKVVINGFKAVGDMTYSTYLIHYPIQVIIILLFHPKDSTPFDSPIVMAAFLASTCVAGYFLFHYFEKPVQNLLRKKLLSKEAKAAQVEEAVTINTQLTPGAS